MSLQTIRIGFSRSLLPIVIAAAALLQMSSQLHADSFVMTSGKVIDGSVVSSSDVSVFIKDTNGLLQSVLLADVAEVRIDLSGGEEIIGRLTSFQDDTYELVTDNWTLFVRDGRVIQSLAVYDEGTQSVVPNAGGPAIGINEQGPATNEPAVNEPAVEVPAVEVPAAEEPAIEPNAPDMPEGIKNRATM